MCSAPPWRRGPQALLSWNAQARGPGMGGVQGADRVMRDSGARPKGRGESSPKWLLLLSWLSGFRVPPALITLLPSAGVASCPLHGVNTKGSLSPNVTSSSSSLFQGWWSTCIQGSQCGPQGSSNPNPTATGLLSLPWPCAGCWKCKPLPRASNCLSADGSGDMEGFLEEESSGDLVQGWCLGA